MSSTLKPKFMPAGALLHSRAALSAVKVYLEEAKENQWTPLQDKAIDLQSLHSAVCFPVQAGGAGIHRYRLRIPSLPEEMTLANNSRSLAVQVSVARSTFSISLRSWERTTKYLCVRNWLRIPASSLRPCIESCRIVLRSRAIKPGIRIWSEDCPRIRRFCRGTIVSSWAPSQGICSRTIRQGSAAVCSKWWSLDLDGRGKFFWQGRLCGKQNRRPLSLGLEKQ